VSDLQDLLRLAPVGPVANAYSRAVVYGLDGGSTPDPDLFLLEGPQGSGKTTANIVNVFRVAQNEHRSPRDGVRRCKWAVIGSTYPNLERTFMEDWFAFFPKEMGYVGAPVRTQTILIDDGKGQIELTMLFLAFGENSVEATMRGLQTTHALLVEATLLPLELFSFIYGRLGRYPRTADGHGAPKRRILMGDTNSPELGTEWHKRLYLEVPANWAVFRQPGGHLAAAENVKNLPAGYYENLRRSMDDHVYRRLVMCEPSNQFSRAAVYPEFAHSLHVAGAPLTPADAQVVAGFDQGLHAAAVFLQWMPDGQWRALAELAPPAEGWDVYTFGEMVQALRASRLKGLQVVGYADMAGGARSSINADQTWLTELRKVTGMRILPCATNAPDLRQTPIRKALKRRTVAGTPGLLIDPACKVLIQGLAGEHRRRLLQPNSDYYGPVLKTEFSHVVEALEYGIMGAVGIGAEPDAEPHAARRALRQVVARSNFGVFP